YDLVRDDKYRYYRCPDKHGIFMPFFDFLRSQDLVRGLTPPEIDALKQKMVAINCPSCGAPIDLQTQTRCQSCGSSLAVGDLAGLGDAVRQLDADAQTSAPRPAGAPPPVPPDEVVADWRADEDERKRFEAELDDERNARLRIDLLDVGVSLLARLLGK